MKSIYLALALLLTVGHVFAADVVCQADYDYSGKVDFNDMLRYAKASNAKAPANNYDPKVDTDSNGAIDFADLLAFARDYGKTCTSSAKKFVLLNDINWRDKPAPQPIGWGDPRMDLPNLFSGEVALFVQNCVWKGDYPNYDTSRGSEPNVRACIRNVKDNMTARYVVFDTEQWNHDIRSASKEDALVALQKLKELVDWAKDESAKYKPEIKLTIGHYGEFPLRDYWTPVNYHLCVSHGVPAATCAKSEGYDKWLEANQFIIDSHAFDTADVVYADTYFFYQDLPSNRVYYQENIAQANKLGKPVISYFWDMFHNGGCNCGHIPGAYWRQMLDDAMNLTSGVVMWSDLERWSDVQQQEFYKETVKFVDEKKKLGVLQVNPRSRVPVPVTRATRK